MGDWDWFTGTNKEYTIPQFSIRNEFIDYYGISRNKERAIEFLTMHPKKMFKIVEYDEDVTFFDLLVEHKTLTEKDLLTIEGLDWKLISQNAPLSKACLRCHKYDVDWEYISKDWCMRYVKDVDFIMEFYDSIVWSKVKKIHVSSKDAVNLIVNGVLPFEVAVKTKCLNIVDIVGFVHMINNDICKDLIEKYSIHEVESIDSDLSESVNAHANLFVRQAWYQKYLPCKYTDVYKHVNDGVNWTMFFKECKPNEEYIERYVIEYISIEGWQYLSKGDIFLSKEFAYKHIEKMYIDFVIKWLPLDLDTMLKLKVKAEYIYKYAQLSAKYIDEHAYEVDWYLVCEHQSLPEWLMRKHVEKLCWGQVSLYQKLSPEFISDFAHLVNHVKLEQNIHKQKR